MEVLRFHVVVIGSGPGGSSAAIRLAKAGLDVAIIEEGSYGGTCPNTGCDPKKILRAGAELAHRSKSLAREGIVKPARIEWNRLMEMKRRLTERTPAKVEESLARAHVRTFHGRASFIDESTVRIGDTALSAERIIVATGARPRDLQIPGAELIATSEDILELDELPEHALFIGGGYISFELAHILNACGVACTIIHEHETLLADFEDVLVRKLVESSREDGIEIVLGSRVESVEQVEQGYHVHASSNDEHHTYETDIAIHGAGRVANIGSLDVHTTSIRIENDTIAVDEYLRATETIYAIGDCAAIGEPLTPVAQKHGRIVARTLLGEPTTYEGEITPRVLFTLPELACVGLTQAQAQRQGLDIKSENHETSSWFSSKRIGQRHSGARIIIDKPSDLIVGAHLFGEGSQELINLFALAMREGIGAASLRRLTYAFPTHSSDIPSLL